MQQRCSLQPHNLDDALDQTECDAVLVATSPGNHVESCKLAISRGLAVMVEKPFTQCLREAVELVRLAEQKGTPLIVTQNYRYMRSFRTARRLISDGVLGAVGMVVCQYYRVPHPMGSLAQLTNNVLWGAGIHHLDALSYTLKPARHRRNGRKFHNAVRRNYHAALQCKCYFRLKTKFTLFIQQPTNPVGTSFLSAVRSFMFAT